jgi:hypothetical protein
MSIHRSASAALVSTSPAESQSLKIWSCTNCRRRKVRCDRHHPCVPCTRNQLECVFPTSGRMPYRSRPSVQDHPPSRKQVEVVGRLRRLEAMVGDLGSQVEHARVRGDLATNSTSRITDVLPSTVSSEAVPSDQISTLDSRYSPSEAQLGAAVAQPADSVESNDSASSLTYDEPSEVTVADNGDLIVGDQFWSVFCKEVTLLYRVSIGTKCICFNSDCIAYLHFR